MSEDCECGCKCKGARLLLSVNGQDVRVNEFVNDSLSGSILGFLSALRLEQGEIKNVKVEIEL